MGNTLLWSAVGAVQLTLLATIAQAQEGSSFFEGFYSFDTARWSKGDHVLGRSYLDLTNVYTSNGNLRIAIPARTLEGGEVRTNALQGYGSYSARMQLPNAPGSITGFFLYKGPDYESEIDIEVFNDSSRRIMFSTYAGGTQTHTETMTLPFDPTTGFHEYRFDYAADSVTFYADGKAMKRWDSGIPQTSMHLMVNTWFPTWLHPKRPNKTVYTLVDYLGYQQQQTVVASN
jgi:beta-glucanase (GH16 family)